MIALQPFDATCYARLIEWVDSEESLMQFAGPAFSFPLTEDQLEKSLSDKKRFAFSVIDKSRKEAIGHSEIYLAENSAYLGRILIGDASLRGQGIGQQTVALLLEYAFINLQQSKAELNVFDWNVSAIRCYQKCGFVINPSKKLERKVNGKIWIAINMVLTKEQWLQSKDPLLANQ